MSRGSVFHPAPIVSLLLVVGAWMDWQFLRGPAGDPDAYHAAIRAAARTIPDRIGDWVAEPVPPPPSAVVLLKPNILVGLDFRNDVTHERVLLSLVQCRDSRDMSGHWPPACYPAMGWTLRETEARAMRIDGREVPFTAYRFTIESLQRFSELVVYSLFLRPDGNIDADRTAVQGSAEHKGRRSFGAGQVQVQFDATIPRARRDDIFRTLVGGVWPVIESVLAGGI